MDARMRRRGRSPYSPWLALMAAGVIIAGCAGVSGGAPNPTRSPNGATMTPVPAPFPGPATAASTTPARIPMAGPAPASAPTPLIHVVEPGDSLWRIAQRYHVPPLTLIAVNPQFPIPRLIHPGDEVWIPRVAMNASSTGRPTRGTLVLTRSLTLKADHRGNIVIRGSDVTLDCAGHVVRGSGLDTEGILVEGGSNVTVKQCIVSGFGRNGLLGNGTGLRLETNWFVGNGNHGAHVAVRGGHVTGNTSRRNGPERPTIGIVATGSTNLTIWANIVESNAWAGIALLDGTTGSMVTGNTALRDGLGFVLDDADGNTLTGNTANQNDHGFTVKGSSTNLLEGNTANRNRYGGFSLHTGCSANTLSANTANGNWDGFTVDGCDGNVLTSNTANTNAHVGFLVGEGSSNNTLSYNTGLNSAETDAVDGGSGNSWVENTFGTWYGF